MLGVIDFQRKRNRSKHIVLWIIFKMATILKRLYGDLAELYLNFAPKKLIKTILKSTKHLVVKVQDSYTEVRQLFILQRAACYVTGRPAPSRRRSHKAACFLRVVHTQNLLYMVFIQNKYVSKVIKCVLGLIFSRR